MSATSAQTPGVLPYGEASKVLMQTTILAAVGELLGERGWDSITMSDVAHRAGVSRQTLYNSFGNRKELVRAYALGVAGSLLDKVEAEALAHSDAPGEALLAAFSLFLKVAADEPIVRALTAPTGADDLATLVATPEGMPIVEAASSRIRQVMLTIAPHADADDVAALAEVVVRLAISYLSVPGSSVAKATEALARVLGPALAAIQP